MSARPIIDFHCHHAAPKWPLKTTIGLPDAERARWEKINAPLASFDNALDSIRDGDLLARVINTPPALILAPGEQLAIDTAKEINDYLAERAGAERSRIYALATVDAFGGEAAAREAERALGSLGLSGLFIESAKGDALLDAPQARPVLAVAAAYGKPVFVHPVNPQPLTSQLERFGRLGTLFARGTVNAATLIALIEGGVFDELPGLRVVVTALAFGGVLQAAQYATRGDIRSDAPQVARRHVYTDIMGFDPVLLRAAVDLLGADHVIAGSDWPIVSTGPIRSRLEKAFDVAGLDEASRELVSSKNTLHLLNGAGAKAS